MATRDKYRYQCDPSDPRSQVMQQARRHELDARRQRVGRTCSIVLVVVAIPGVASLWLIPRVPVRASHSTARPVMPSPELSRGVQIARQTLDFAAPTTASPAVQPAATVAEVDPKAAVAMP